MKRISPFPLLFKRAERKIQTLYVWIARSQTAGKGRDRVKLSRRTSDTVYLSVKYSGDLFFQQIADFLE